MTKKQILGITALILSLLIAVSVFAGCNAGAPETVAPNAPEAESAETKTDSTETVAVDDEERCSTPTILRQSRKPLRLFSP